MRIIEFLKKVDELRGEFTSFNVSCRVESVEEGLIIGQIIINLKIGSYEYYQNDRHERLYPSSDIDQDFTETFESIQKFIAKSKAKQAIDAI